MSADIAKIDLYRKLGFGGDPAVYEEVLRQAGLSRPGKARISSGKVEQVEQLFRSRFVPVCERLECRELARIRSAGRTAIPAAAPGDCEFCGGSINALAIAEMIRACRRVGWTRLCIVGGSPNTTSQLASLVGTELQLRIVDGTTSRTRRDAEADLSWADRVVIWGATELAHKVSALYKGPNVITAPRRGVAEVARAVTTSAARAG